MPQAIYCSSHYKILKESNWDIGNFERLRKKHIGINLALNDNKLGEKKHQGHLYSTNYHIGGKDIA